MKRRTFIQRSAAVAGTMAAAGLWSCAGNKPAVAGTLTGVQLYSIRDDMGKDPLGTLKALSAMGYQHVEHAGYKARKFYGYAPADFKKLLADLGMDMPSGHTVLGKDHWDDAAGGFTDLWKQTVEDAAAAGQTFVISPWLDSSIRTSMDDLKKYMDIFNKSGELCSTFGMKFGYHNHDFEFSESLEGKTLYDHILEKTDPNLVIQQLDIGNLYNGGAVALDIVKKWPGRFQSMHVKDEITSSEGHEKYESTILGTGIVGVKDVIDLGKNQGGTIHFIIEQESYQGRTPLDSVKEDLEIMKKWGY